MAVDKAGKDELALQVDDFGVVTDPFLGVGAAADEDDAVTPDGYRLGHRASIVHRVDNAVGENHVGLSGPVKELRQYLGRFTPGGILGRVPVGQVDDAGQHTVVLGLLDVGAMEWIGVVEDPSPACRRFRQRVIGCAHCDADGLLPGDVVGEPEVAVQVAVHDALGRRHRRIAAGVERVVHRVVGVGSVLEGGLIGGRDLVAQGEHRHLGELLAQQRIIGFESAVCVSAGKTPGRDIQDTGFVWVAVDIRELSGRRSGDRHR